MQIGFLNWGILEMEMECDDLSWKKVLTQYSVVGSVENLTVRLFDILWVVGLGG